MKDDKYLELDFKDRSSEFPLDRRAFLKIAGGGIFILFTVGDTLVFSQEGRGSRQNLPSDFNAFLRIGEDGRVSCFTGKTGNPAVFANPEKGIKIGGQVLP